MESTSRLTLLLALGLSACVGAPPTATSSAAALGELAPSPDAPAAAVGSWRLALPDAPDAIVTQGPHFHAISLRRGQRTISLHSSDVVHASAQDVANGEPMPDVAPTDSVRGGPAYVTVNEGIRSVAWQEAGAFHALEVECFRPFEDPHCTESTFLLELVETLVGGAQ